MPPPVDEPIDPATVPMLDATVIPTAETPLVVQTTLPSLPVALDLAVNNTVLTPTATTLLTLTLESQTVTPLSALTLTLTLPDGLRSVQGQTGTLTWPVAALDPGQSVTQTVEVEPATPMQTSAVLTLAALVQGADYEPVHAVTLVGLAHASATTDTQTEQGAVLQDAAAGITLLAPPEAAPIGVTFNYTPLYSALAPLATEIV
jgi:hypothetical protein